MVRPRKDRLGERQQSPAGAFLPAVASAEGTPALQHSLHGSVDEMLSLETLSALEGRAVSEVRRLPFHHSDAKSGGQFLVVETGDSPGHRYILKRISYRDDWIMRVTDDRHGRPIVAWQRGLLDRLPPEIIHGVVTAATDGDGWAILMHDFREDMIPPGDDLIDEEENVALLDAMAALHATFWEEPEVADPTYGFSRLINRYDMLSPRMSRRTMGAEPILALVAEGWELAYDSVPADVSAVVKHLQKNLEPLCSALMRYPQTVVHGDWKIGNLGLIERSRGPVILLDWAVTGPAPPAVDLAWYLAINSARLPISKEESIDLYRRRLQERLGARFDEGWWLPQLELSLLGAFLQLGWDKAFSALHGAEAVQARERAELAWWAERVRAGVRWL